MIRYGNELYHYGILGQKWGVRRYQNDDGSLTPEGEKRYGSGSKKYYSQDAIRKYELNSRRTDELNDDELKELNNRLSLENTRRTLSAQNMSTGKNFVKAVFAGAAIAGISAGASFLTYKGFANAGKEFYNIDIKPIIQNAAKTAGGVGNTVGAGVELSKMKQNISYPKV